MRKSRIAILVACLIAYSVPSFANGPSDGPILAKAAGLFGKQLSAEHHVFSLNDTYVIWLVLATDGELLEVDVGPRTHYTTEFPNVKNPPNPQYLSEVEYEDALDKISELKDLGKLQKRHGTAVASDFGPLSTDRFEKAFVERVDGTHQAESQTGVEDIKKFNVYFIQEMWGSPEQVLKVQEQSMICLGKIWYYLPPNETTKVHLGKWQKMRVAGPNLQRSGCVRTTPPYDADGFTIEEPQNETIVISEPYTTRALAGAVYDIWNAPIEGVNVEVRRIGSKNVLRTKTNAAGTFGFPDPREGKYKFKVTKDGFKSLSGTIFVKRKAGEERLSFKITVGT